MCSHEPWFFLEHDDEAKCGYCECLLIADRHLISIRLSQQHLTNLWSVFCSICNINVHIGPQQPMVLSDTDSFYLYHLTCCVLLEQPLADWICNEGCWMNVGLRHRKTLERSCDSLIWKVLGGGGALRGLKRLTYDGVMYFYFRYPLMIPRLNRNFIYVMSRERAKLGF